MPLSDNRASRRKQIANLKKGRPGAGVANVQPAPNPAGPGNRRHVTHGAYAKIAPERLRAKEREIFVALAEDAPVRDPDGGLPAADAPAVTLLASTLCRIESVGAYLEDVGWTDEDGRPRPILDYEARLRATALDQLEALAMTPRSRAKLGVDLVRARRSFEEEVAEASSAWDAVDGSEAP